MVPGELKKRIKPLTKAKISDILLSFTTKLLIHEPFARYHTSTTKPTKRVARSEQKNHTNHV